MTRSTRMTASGAALSAHGAPVARARLAALAGALLLALCGPALAQDSAYVDSPAGRSVADPARADGGSVAPGTVFVRPANGQGSLNAMSQMQMQMAGMAMANALRPQPQPAAGNAADGDAGMAQAGMPGMPGGAPMSQGMDGTGGGGPGGQGMQGPMQQVGSGLVRDAGNLVDAGLRRSIYGNNAVFVPATTQEPPADGDGGW